MSRFPVPRVEPPSSARWRTEEYATALRAFVTQAVGPVEILGTKVRPWSVVWEVGARAGRFWAKENSPGASFEAALLGVLAAQVPDRVVPVTALDAVAGRLLTPDQGEVLGDDGTVDMWARVVGEWALLQRETLRLTEQIAGLGVPTLAVADCTELVEDRLAALSALPAPDPRRLDDEQATQVRQALPSVRAAVDLVGALGLPPALNHNDLHGHNAFATDPGAPLRFFDLGDAMLTDPAAVLLIPLGGLRDALGCAADDDRLWRVADTWVEVWSDLVDPRELRAALPESLRLARLARHDSWLRVTTGLDEQEAVDWGMAPAHWLAAIGDPPVLQKRA